MCTSVKSGGKRGRVQWMERLRGAGSGGDRVRVDDPESLAAEAKNHEFAGPEALLHLVEIGVGLGRIEKVAGTVRGSAVGEEVVDAEAGLACDLAEEKRGKIAGTVNGYGGGSAVRVSEPLVGAALAHLSEAERGEDRDDLARPQRRSGGHGRQTRTVWVPTNSVSGW